MRRILIVEDDKAIRRGIADALAFDGYETLEAGNGQVGAEMAVRGNYDLLLLDLVLPARDGFDILREVRQARPTLPVIILTARGSEDERVRGLRLGADDYIVKPFSVKELLARIEAVLRRSPERPLDVDKVAVPGGEASLASSEVVFANGERRQLSEREVALLRYLAANVGRAVSREEILSRVWRVSPNVATRTIDMHVARLRDKLRADPTKPDVIVTVRGKGYLYREPAAP